MLIIFKFLLYTCTELIMQDCLATIPPHPFYIGERDDDYDVAESLFDQDSMWFVSPQLFFHYTLRPIVTVAGCYKLYIPCIYKVYTTYMSGIYSKITLHYFHGELCCVEKFCVLHSIALNSGMGLLHRNSKKYIKIEF
jgi:hypothetical protein